MQMGSTNQHRDGVHADRNHHPLKQKLGKTIRSSTKRSQLLAWTSQVTRYNPVKLD